MKPLAGIIRHRKIPAAWASARIVVGDLVCAMIFPKVWIESALNGAWGRDRQPAIPISIEEIIADGVAAAKAGAAIIHLHAYDAATGRQRDAYEIYAPIIEGIRAEVDAIVYPTLPITAAGPGGEPRGARERYAHVERLARNGLLEWAVIDPGSAVFTRFDQIARGEAGDDLPVKRQDFRLAPPRMDGRAMFAAADPAQP